MELQSKKQQSKVSPVNWDSIPGLKWTGEKAELFWEWFLEASEISKHDFLKELDVDNNPANAIDRLFAKMNKAEAARGKKHKSTRGDRTH
jgi:hypothetical protein